MHLDDQDQRVSRPLPLLPHALPKPDAALLTLTGDREHNLLADEKHVNGAEIEVIKEGEGGQTVVSWVLTGIELASELARTLARVMYFPRRRTMTVFPLYWMM